MKAVHTIKVMEDGTVTLNGKESTWEKAHAAITVGRKHNQEIRKTATTSKRMEKRAARAERLLARKAKLEEQLAALNSTANPATA